MQGNGPKSSKMVPKMAFFSRSERYETKTQKTLHVVCSLAATMY